MQVNSLLLLWYNYILLISLNLHFGFIGLAYCQSDIGIKQYVVIIKLHGFVLFHIIIIILEARTDRFSLSHTITAHSSKLSGK